MTQVKICGLCRPADARRASELGADYLGVILVPGTPRSQTAETASSIWEAAPGANRVGVFVDQPDDEVVRLGKELGLSVIQLHGAETPESTVRLRGAGPWRVWKAVRPITGDDFEAAVERYGGRVDGLLVDGFSKAASGGTGARFDWSAVARRRGALGPGTQLIVAGGLEPGNVARAIAMLAPDIVDVSSGVESELCAKSAQLLESFVTAVRGAVSGAGQG